MIRLAPRGPTHRLPPGSTPAKRARLFGLRVRALGLAIPWGSLPLFGAAPASAQVDARQVLDSLTQAVPPERVPAALGLTTATLGLVAELPSGGRTPRPGLVPIAGNFAVVRGNVAELQQLMAQNPDVRFHWSPPLRPQLDRATSWARADVARQSTGLSGAGVVVGIIDTGVDTQHPALRHADGTTRVRWLIDFGEGPRGRHPELEAEYGCAGDNPCSVLSSDEIDELLENDVAGDEPTDPIGHGTHVASIAAGNGAPDGTYEGIAPEADLIIAQVSERSSGSISDVNILTAARFVFERAAELGLPAVVNISLGSNFGAHDGSAPLERGLVELLDGPGRSIVVAAGNSAGQFLNISPAYPGPFGVHTEVHVAPNGTTRVPILTPALTTRPTRARLFAWIASAPGDDLQVGFATGQGGMTQPMPRGSGGTFSASRLGDSDDYAVTIINGVAENPLGVTLPANSAILLLAGEWRAGRSFAIHLEGHGSARIWLESGGDLDPSVSLGALLPASRKAGTVSIPGSHPRLIAVGATTNRTSWTTHTGALIDQPGHGALSDAPGDTTAFFSSAGPTNAGLLKPDLVAPGVNVIAAMSAAADPRSSNGGLSQFNGAGRCGGEPQCLVVNDQYALASGTSMAAPVVTGSIALLLQREPELTQDRIRALLQAGSRPVEGAIFVQEQVGAGSLDVVGTLRAQDAAQGSTEPPEEARLELAQAFAYPDPARPLHGLLVLRDARGRPAGGFERQRLTASAPGAAALELHEETAGLWRLSVAYPQGSGGRTADLTIAFDGVPLATRRVPIAVDPHTAQSGFSAGGGCTWAPSPQAAGPWLPLLLSCVLLRPIRRRRRGSGGGYRGRRAS